MEFSSYKPLTFTYRLKMDFILFWRNNGPSLKENMLSIPLFLSWSQFLIMFLIEENLYGETHNTNSLNSNWHCFPMEIVWNIGKIIQLRNGLFKLTVPQVTMNSYFKCKLGSEGWYLPLLPMHLLLDIPTQKERKTIVVKTTNWHKFKWHVQRYTSVSLSLDVVTGP